MTKSAREAIDAITAAHAAARGRLKKCQELPAFQAQHMSASRELRAKLDRTNDEATAAVATYLTPLKKREEELTEKQSRLQGEVSAMRAQLGEALPVDRPRLEAKAEAANESLKVVQQELKNEQNSYQGRVDEAFQKEVPELTKLLDEMYDHFDESFRLEREIRESEGLRAGVGADTAQKEDDFSKAEGFHRRQAWLMLVAMLIILILTGVIVYLLFLHPSIEPLPLPEGGGRWELVERVGLVGIGRLAILFFAAWGLKYTGGLHRQHAEQAVIYCDRRASLGVMRTILDSTSQVDQKRAVLEKLADSYLNFEQSAFRSQRGGETNAGESDLQTVKQAIDTLRPLLDSLKGIFEKVK